MSLFNLNPNRGNSNKNSAITPSSIGKTRDFLDDYNNLFKKNLNLPNLFDSTPDESVNNLVNISDENQFSKEISIIMQDDEDDSDASQTQEEVDIEENNSTEEEIQAEKITQYSQDPEFCTLCQQYFGNFGTSDLSPSEMFNTGYYVSFEDLESLHDTLLEKNNLNVQLKAVQDFYYSNNMEIPDDIKSSIDALNSTDIYDMNNIAGSYLWQMQYSLEDLNGVLTENLDNLQSSNYNIAYTKDGQISEISMTLKDEQGNDVSSVIKYAEDGQTPLTKTTTTTDGTTTTTYDANGNSVTTGDNGTVTSEQVSLANLSAASGNKDYTSGQISDNINAFLSSDGSMPLTDELSEATSLDDAFEAMVIANNGDKSTARTMLNAMLANDDVKSKLGGSEIYIDENNQIIKDGVLAYGYVENPFQNTENLAINAMFDITNGRYVISDDILSALSEKTKTYDAAEHIITQTEYYTDINGNVYTRNIENTYDENGSISSTSATTYDPSTNTVKCIETSTLIDENGETKIKTTKTDANGNIIIERTETVDEYQNTQQLESIARKYTDKDDLSKEDLDKYLTIDSLTKDNDQAMEMLFNQLADEGIITKGWDLLKQITTLGIDKKEIANIIVQNKSNVDELLDGMNKDDGSFEAKYKELYGVEYDQDTIDQARLLQAEVQIYTEKQSKFTQIDLQLKNAYNNGDDAAAIEILTGIYGDETVAKEKYQEYTEEQDFLSGMADEMLLNMDVADQISDLWEQKFVDFYGEETGKAKFAQAMNGNLADNIDWDHCNFNNINSNIYEDLNNNLNENFEAQGIDTNTLVEDYLNKYNEAFGTSSQVDITKMLHDYANDQNQVIDRVAGFVQGAGTVLMVGGIAIAMVGSGGTAAPVAAWMLTAGKTAAIGGIFAQDAAHLVNEVTSKNASAEDINNILYDAAQDAALYYSGRIIGKLSNGAHEFVAKAITKHNGSELVANIIGSTVEVAIDAPLSYYTDKAITGNVSLESEGFSQMLALMTGIAQEKINVMKVKTTSPDVSSAGTVASGAVVLDADSSIKPQTDGEIKVGNTTSDTEVSLVSSEAYNKALTEIRFNTSGYTTEQESVIAGLMVTNNCDVYVAKTVLDNNYSAEQSKTYFDLVQQGLDSTSAKYMMDGYDMETAKSLSGRDAYTYSEGLSQIVLRKGLSLDRLAQDETGILTKYFIESGYDNLSTPLETDITVQRVVRVGGDSDYEIDWKVGDEITEEGFTSTSPKGNNNFANESEWRAKRDNAELVNIEINVPAGTKVVNMQNAYDEILLKNGSTFKVSGYNAETNTYTLDLVPTADSKIISDTSVKAADTDIKTAVVANSGVLKAGSEEFSDAVSYMSKANDVQAYRFNPNGTAEEILSNNPGVFVNADGQYCIPNKWEPDSPYVIDTSKEQMIMMYGSDDMAVCDGGIFNGSYVDTAAFKADSSLDYLNPTNLEYGQVINATKQAAGSYKIVPEGTQIETLEGVRTVQSGEVVALDYAGNPYVTTAQNIIKRNILSDNAKAELEAFIAGSSEKIVTPAVENNTEVKVDDTTKQETDITTPKENPYNLKNVTSAEEVGILAAAAIGDKTYRIATAGYSAAPEGYEDSTKAFLKALNEELGTDDTAFVTSPTADKGSIDAITTEVAGADGSKLFYLTATDYVDYINPDNFPASIDKTQYASQEKAVLPNAAEYSKATATASNLFIATGGRNATVSDFCNAIISGNKAIIYNNSDLDVAAWGEAKSRVENGSKYLTEQIKAFQAGEELPYPECGGLTKEFLETYGDVIAKNVLVVDSSDGNAAQKAALFVTGDTSVTDTAEPTFSDVISAQSDIVLGSKIPSISQPSNVEAFVPDLTADDSVLKALGLQKEGDSWYSPNREWFPRAITENDVVIVYAKDAAGNPTDIGFCSKEEFAHIYTDTEKYNSGEIDYIDPTTMSKNTVFAATKCASGVACILPVGTKVQTQEGEVVVKANEVAAINETENSIYIMSIDKYISKYMPDPNNPASKELFKLLSDYKSSITADSTPEELIAAHNALSDSFNRLNRAQKLVEISGTQDTPQTLKDEYTLANQIVKSLDEKYFSRLDVSNFDDALKNAEGILKEISADTSLTDTQKDLAKTAIMVKLLPKTNSHQHLKGSVPQEVTLEIGEQKGMDLTPLKTAYAKAEEGYANLNEFNAAYGTIGKPISTVSDYEAAIKGIMKESAQEGQLVTEIRCAVDSLKNEDGTYLTPQEGTDAIISSIRKAEAQLTEEGISAPATGFVFLSYRGKDWDSSLKAATIQAGEAVRASIENPDMRFGFDIAGPEDTGYGPKAFSEAIQVIKDYNESVKSGLVEGQTIGITMHAGETPTYDGGKAGYLSIEDAIDMGVDRIGHGVQAVLHPETIEKIKEAGVTVEICGVCNIQTIPINTEGLALHPIQEFIKQGVKTTICTDNDTICNTDITKEYMQFLLTGHGQFMDWNKIKQSARNGISSSFISDTQKAAVTKEAEDRISQIQKLINGVQ